MKNLILIICVTLPFLTGCQEEPHIETPSEVVVKHFDALYNQDNFDAAMAYASQRHQKLMQSYGTTRSVGRYLYNMSYDKIEVSVQAPLHPPKRSDTESLRLNLAVTGYKGDKHYENFRIAVMTVEEGRWKLERLLSGPYN
ncbi:hypothetical protein CWE15_02495 [Aliidiomarina taiwanensis]|uniref:DUF4878 domain-containing protein n=1 Tax=Aliidiomarina taiwanensis TaxID=946228 RepID=A0A432X9R4_9GAMM|nr:hypothetical protein [Aliidiomarina taiwanensis]RUO44064.1 hypothetical protein CWE15_02495 [Aliidiomarina taiwanensis]